MRSLGLIVDPLLPYRMIHLQYANATDILAKTALREGETKLGEQFEYLTALEDLRDSTATYVVFGIEEDIGVQANFGKKGTAKAWDAFLNTFVNLQYNRYTHKNIILLGSIKVVPSEPINKNTPKQSLGDIVDRIDKMVSQVVSAVVRANKIPIIIGGGHNNAFGNIKGVSLAKNNPINVINIDAHTDLRPLDYRHSGNGFSAAYRQDDQRYLELYSIFGLHANYTSQAIFDWMDQRPQQIEYKLFEDITNETDALHVFKTMISKLQNADIGLELDCDAIQDFPTSAQTPSGFALNTIRKCVTLAASLPQIAYFHLCEAAPTKMTSGQVGKALSYLVSDFIRAHDKH